MPGQLLQAANAAVGQRVRVARREQGPNGAAGAIVAVNRITGNVTVKLDGGTQPPTVDMMPEYLEDLAGNGEVSATVSLFRSLTPHARGALMDHMRLFMCWQLVVGWVGAGAAAAAPLEWLLRHVFAYAGIGTTHRPLAPHYMWHPTTWSKAGWFFLACWVAHVLDGKAVGLLPQVKGWLSDQTGGPHHGYWVLCNSPGYSFVRVAAFAAGALCAGVEPSLRMLLVASCAYHLHGACLDFDEFRRAHRFGELGSGLEKARRRAAEADIDAAKDPAKGPPKDAAADALRQGEREEGLENEDLMKLWTGLAPYARLGLGTGLGLATLWPWHRVASGAFVAVALSCCLRIFRGLPAAVAVTAVLAIAAAAYAGA